MALCLAITWRLDQISQASGYCAVAWHKAMRSHVKFFFNCCVSVFCAIAWPACLPTSTNHISINLYSHFASLMLLGCSFDHFLHESASQIQPPVGEAAVLSLPLTFFDILWLHSQPIRRLIFYETPCSKADFFETHLPNLKQSLSLTLKHYLPLSGNLLYPLHTQNKPIIRYVPGDSVSLTVSESASDFDNLVGNHARDADQFYDFVPQLPPLKDEPDYKAAPVFALQVTLFPGRGLCFGLANHHCIGDASSILSFMKSWASITKLGGDEEYLIESRPLFDRSLISDPLGIDSIWLKAMKDIPPRSSSFPIPTGRVRATFVLSRSEIDKLKNIVLAKKPDLVQVSSFAVTTAYVWHCFVKSGDEVVLDDDEFFIFPVDYRTRMDPPVPANYFGNCIVSGGVVVRQPELRGSEGFEIAAAAVAEIIKNRVNKKNELLKGAENWSEDKKNFVGMRSIGVSGSPMFDLYSVDFGWGKARKIEVLSIDGENYSMSLCKSYDSKGGLEVGLSLPKERMEIFADIFARGLSNFN